MIKYISYCVYGFSPIYCFNKCYTAEVNYIVVTQFLASFYHTGSTSYLIHLNRRVKVYTLYSTFWINFPLTKRQCSHPRFKISVHEYHWRREDKQKISEIYLKYIYPVKTSLRFMSVNYTSGISFFILQLTQICISLKGKVYVQYRIVKYYRITNLKYYTD